MTRKVVAVLLVVGAITLLCVGCGGGSRKVSPSNGTNLFPDYNGPTGSVVLHVIWPQRDTREIPPETTVIDIEVTGEGLTRAREARIQMPATFTRIDNLPIGQKGISATARKQLGGPPLAFGFATTIVEPNKVKDVSITLQRIEQIGVAAARAMIQEVRDAAITLSSGIANELVNQALVWQADLIPTFALTMQRLDFVKAILTRAHWAEVDDEWVVQFPEGDALLKGMTLTFKLVRKTNNYKVNEGEFKVTSTTESQLLYEGKLTIEADTQNRLTKITVNGTFKDKFLPDGIIVNGTLTGTPQDQAQKSYTRVGFTGSIQSPKVSLTIGEATATFNPPSDSEKWDHFLTKAELKNFRFKTERVAEPIEVTGELSVETQIDQQTPEKGPLPKTGKFRGGYQSSNLTFDGTINFDWQNPAWELMEPPKGTARITGRWAMRNKPVFSVSFTLTADSPFEVDIDITCGDHFLRGKLTGDWQVANGIGSLKVTNWSVTLKNESNLSLEFRKGTERGIIKAPDGTKLADIQKDPDLNLWVVRYIDGTLESLEPTDMTFTPHPTE